MISWASIYIYHYTTHKKYFEMYLGLPIYKLNGQKLYCVRLKDGTQDNVTESCFSFSQTLKAAIVSMSMFSLV